MPLNPMMMPPMHPPIQGGDDTTMVFIIVIIFCCSVFCAFIYFYIQQENEDETSDTCTEHTDSVSCSADTSCAWNTESFLCNKIESIAVTKCSVEEHVLSGECNPCPKFPNGSFSMKSPEEVVLKDADDTTCSVKQPCPENYHVSGGTCVACEGSLIRPAGDDPTSSEDTVCKRALCNNNQRIDCDGSCGDETCCCVDCPSGQESTKIHDTSPDDASVSDAQCVEIGMGVSSQLQDPSSSGSSQSSNEQLCNLNQRVNSSGNCENCRLGETTSSRHDPNGGETQCDKADCSEGQYALHTIPGGGACAFCSGLNTNDGGFRPNDMTKGECLKCKAESYLSDTNTCLRCPGDKINPAGSFFKTDTSMIGESVCRSPLCSDTQKINCYKGSSSDDWNCECRDCDLDAGGNQQYSITPHTIHPEDYPPFISVEDTELQYSSECVNFCDGAGYISKVSGFEEIVLECEREGLCLGIECEGGTDCSDNGDNCNVCSERNLKGTLTRIDDLINECSSKSNDGLNILKGRIKTLLLSSPCPVNYKYSVGVPDTLLDSPNSCVRCENDREIGSYPEGRVDNFDSNHPHSNPRANAGDQSTVCKRFPCEPGKPLECSGGLNADNLCPGGYICGSACPSGETGLPLINNGNHQISPDDAMGSDVTVCRDPNAVLATCGNIDGLGGTIAEECGENYYPVTGDALETLCEGSTCDLTPGTGADHGKCCVENETCAGRILYEGNVGNVTSGGVITIILPDETSSLSDEIIGKKIRFTVPPPRDAGEGWTRSSCMAAISTAQRMRTPLRLGHGCSCSNSNDCLSGNCKDTGSSIYGGRNLSNTGDSGCKPPVLATPIKTNYTGTISNYDHSSGVHNISVTYGDDDDSGIPSGRTNITFKIIEELSSSCPTGTISNNNPDIHCIGPSCDFTGLTDPGICCVVAEDGYIVSLNQRCEFKGEADSTITLEHVFDDDIDAGKVKCKQAYDWITTNKDGHTPMRDVSLDGESPFIHPHGGGLDNKSPPGCWWWDPHSGEAREGARVNQKNKLWYNTKESLGSNPDTSMKFKKAICKGPSPEVEKAYANQPVANPEENLFGTGWRPIPLNGVHGEGRSSEANWQACQQRCLDTTGCIYFNSYSDGGCHITDGRDGFDKPSNSPSKSGRARWALETE